MKFWTLSDNLKRFIEMPCAHGRQALTSALWGLDAGGENT